MVVGLFFVRFFVEAFGHYGAGEGFAADAHFQWRSLGGVADVDESHSHALVN